MPAMWLGRREEQPEKAKTQVQQKPPFRREAKERVHVEA
jgi:hypothetical protein